MKTILTALAFTAIMVAQTATNPADRYFTQGQANCRYFNDAGDAAQLSYVIGIRDGLGLSTDNRIVVASTHGEIQEGMKAICSKPENALIRAVDAYTLFALRIKGYSDADLSYVATRVRYYAAHGAWPPDPDDEPAADSKPVPKGKL